MIHQPVFEGIESCKKEAEELISHGPSKRDLPIDNKDCSNPMVLQSLGQLPDMCPQFEGSQKFIKDMKQGYLKDPLCVKPMDNILHHPRFEIANGLIYTKNRADETVLCLPSCFSGNRKATEIVLDQAHKTLGHYGPQKTAEYVRRYFWWSRIGQDAEQFCNTCAICQTTKSSTQRVPGLLHSLPVPYLPWNSIAMDFVGPFPESKDHDYLWVVLCRLTSMVHLIPIRTTTTASELAWLYI